MSSIVFTSVNVIPIFIQLTATETKNYDDAFTLELVTEKLLDNFNYVAGIVPILTSHIRIVNTCMLL